MPTLTLEKVYSYLSSRITTTNKELTKINGTLKRQGEVLKFLTHKQFEADDRFDSVDERFDGIDKKLESMERSLAFLNSLPALHKLVHQILRQLTEMQKERIYHPALAGSIPFLVIPNEMRNLAKRLLRHSETSSGFF